MVDVLCRAGQLTEGRKLIELIIKNSEKAGTNSLTPKQIEILWMTLLGGCRTHNDIENIENVAEKILEINP
jgi:pentatricopeptide repeat protein